MPTNRSRYAASLDRGQARISVLVVAVVLLTGVVSIVAFVAFAWPSRDLGDEFARFYVGEVDDFMVGAPVNFLSETDGRSFWLVKGEDGSFSALIDREPRGCRLPWREDFEFPDTRDGITKAGWFRDPCRGSTYDVNGIRVFGPACRNMDEFPVKLEGMSVYVRANLNGFIQGAPSSRYSPCRG